MRAWWFVGVVGCADGTAPVEVARPDSLGADVEIGFADAARRVADEEYQLQRDGSAPWWWNRRHGMRAEVAADHLAVDVGGAALTVRTAGVGRGAAPPSGSAPFAVGGCASDTRDLRGDCLRRVERPVGADVVEWWANTRDGYEHGWDVARRPPGDGPLTLAVAFDGYEVVDVAPDVATLRAGAWTVEYRDPSAVDADGRALPTRLVAHDGGVRVLVDDALARYPIVVDPYLSGPQWRVDGTQANAMLGSAARIVGDVNNDGYDDAVFTEALYDGAFTDEGRVLLYLGGPSGLSATPAATTLTGGQANAMLGVAVLGLGDVDGDGFDDLAVSAPLWDTGNLNVGQVRIVRGSASGFGATLQTIQGTVAVESLGTAIASADFNADGRPDLALGSPTFESGQSNEGAVRIYHGQVGGTFGSIVRTYEGDATFAMMGSRATLATGDVNGDGKADLIVASPRHGSGHGRVRAFHGSASGLGPSAATTLDGTNSGWFGNAVALADVNNDGRDDLLVGESEYATGQGRVHLFQGSAAGLGATAVRTWNGTAQGSKLGWRLASPGDLDGDGFDDFAALALNGGFGGRGQVQVFRGTTGTGPTSFAIRFDVEVSDAPDQADLGGRGDVDGDGHPDLAVGSNGSDAGGNSSGRALLYAGGPDGLTGLIEVVSSPVGGTNNSFGNAIQAVGDVDQDGYDDVAVACSGCFNNMGRVYLYKGGPDGIEPTPAQILAGASSGDGFGRALAFLFDLDDDGDGELVVGAPGHDTGGNNAGRVYVFPDIGTTFATTPSWTVDGTSADGLAGYGLASGDLDCNGSWDLAIGAIYANNGGVKGRVTVHRDVGSTLGAATTTIDGVSDYGELGRHLAVGDVNADGCGDLVATAYLEAAGGTNRGQVRAFYGTTTGPAATASWTVSGAVNSQGLGSGLVVADFDEDGVSDLAISDFGPPTGTGRVHVHLGGAGGPSTSPTTTLTFGTPGSYLGSPLANLGDLSQEGRFDVGLFTEKQDVGARVHLGALGVGLDSAPVYTTPWGFGVPVFGGAAGDVNGDGWADALLAGTESLLTLYGTPVGPRLEVDCLDLDNDGLCWTVDDDDDGDGDLDAEENWPFDPFICDDDDADLCDDCTYGHKSTANDGPDADADGICEATDPNPTDPASCGERDGDGCDDCTHFARQSIEVDGVDRDHDYFCDVGDPDDDGDTVLDDADPAPLDPNRCGDTDHDGCDDCAVAGSPQPNNDGPDAGGDGACDSPSVDACPRDPRESIDDACGCGFEERSGACVSFTALVAPEATIGAGTWVMPGAIVNVGAEVGTNAVIGARAVLDVDAVVADDARVGRRAFVGLGANLGAGVVLAADVEVAANAAIGDACLVGYGSRILDHARLGPDCVIGNLATVGDHATCGVEVGGSGDCHLGRGAMIGDAAVVETGLRAGADTIVGPDSEVGREVTLRSGARIDADAQVGDFVVLGRSARIGVGARVEDGVRLGGDAVVGDGLCLLTPNAVVERGQSVGDACP